jgi:tannase/feruloyl esterase
MRVLAAGVCRTRPLCPYPEAAAYKGSGSTQEAANFVCKAPLSGARAKEKQETEEAAQKR